HPHPIRRRTGRRDRSVARHDAPCPTAASVEERRPVIKEGSVFIIHHGELPPQEEKAPSWAPWSRWGGTARGGRPPLSGRRQARGAGGACAPSPGGGPRCGPPPRGPLRR